MVMSKIISKSSLVLAASPETEWGIAKKGRDRIDGRIMNGINSVEPQIIMVIVIVVLFYFLPLNYIRFQTIKCTYTPYSVRSTLDTLVTGVH